jgi:O-antigen ligase
MSSSHAQWFGRGLVAILAWGVLAFGGVYPWAYWPLAAGCAALGLWGSISTRVWEDPRVVRFAVSLLLVIGAIAIQTLALPYSVLARISPSVDRFMRGFQVGYHPAALHSLSLDAGATLVVLTLALSFALLMVGLSRAMRYLRLDWLIGQIMGLGVALSIVGVVQKASIDPDKPRIYGFWTPEDGGNPFGPFINRNHFAGWMLMAIPLVAAHAWAVLHRAEGESDSSGAGRWMRWSSTVEGNRFVLISVSGLIMAAALVLTASRSGLASFAVGLVVLTWFLMARVGTGRRRAAVALYMAVVLVGALAWAGSGAIFSRFGRASAEAGSRFSAWEDTSRIIADFGVFGTGLGGYRTAMLSYQTTDRTLMYQQAHNDYLQLAAEGGLLVCVPALAAIGVLAAGIRRRLKAGDESVETYWVRRGAIAGLIAIATQSLVEFSLQMPGNTVLFIVLVAIAFHRPRTLHHARRI